MLEMLKKYRKYVLGAYFLLCVIYCVVKIAIPVETTVGEGLENLGRRQIVERTAYLNEGDTISFTLPVESKTLTSIGFYLNTDQLVLDGKLNIRVLEESSGKELVSSSILMNEIEVDQFVQTTVDHYTGGNVLVELTVDDCEQGPRFWLNSTTETAAKSWYNGDEMKYPLVYNAGFSVMTREIKSAVVGTMMAILLGVVVLLATGESKKEKNLNNPAFLEKIGAFYKKYRLVFGGMLVIGIVAVLFFYVYDTQIRIVMNTTEREQIISASEPETLLFSEAENEIIQLVKCEEETLTGLGVQLYVPENAELKGTLAGTVTDLTTGEVLSENVLDMSGAIDGEYINFLFTHEVTDTKAHTFEIKLTPSEELQDTELGIYTTEKGELTTQVHKYFNIFLKKYFFFMFVAAELFAMLFYWMVFIKKCKIETTVFVSLLFLGLIYNFLLLPYMSPDERTHIDMTYRYSNDLLGIEYTGSDITIAKRMDDTEVELLENPSLSNYYTVYNHVFEGVKDDSLVVTNSTANTYAPIFVYLPAVVGMTMARLLGFGTIPMLMLARWCNLAFFAACIWWCMKKLPFGKMALAVIALFPMTIQQCNSFSYDAVITSVLFLFSTYIICMTYEDKPLKGTDVAIVSVLSALLVYGKSGVYLPVCLAALLIPTKKFGTLWKKLAAAGSLMGIALLSYINRNSGTVTQVLSTTAETSAVGATAGNAVDMGYTVGYFLQNPWKLIQMLANTVADKTEFYLESIVGQKMGWVEIEISRVVFIGFLVLFLISMLKVRGEKQYVTGGQKWWISIVCLLSAGMILMGMLLTWTPFGYVSIEGVQGRYFTPLLLLLSLLGRNRTILLNENKDRAIFCGGMILQLLAVIYLIKALIVVA
ncbi:MAG: DUF2142 domain-containing protein [Lachnospiraceae bacterium]|nr:DUF2142 domain-containing protein [Lachnospiraceae bacterium]